MSLHYLVKREMLIEHVLPLSRQRKFIPPQLLPPNLSANLEATVKVK